MGSDPAGLESEFAWLSVLLRTTDSELADFRGGAGEIGDEADLGVRFTGLEHTQARWSAA